MHSMYRLILFLFISTGFISCEKVIDVDIRESDRRYVIEGVITDEPGVCNIRLTRTIHFNDPNVFPAVSGAVVKVKDNGVEYTLNETSPGNYSTTAINGTPGHLYQLSIVVNGESFTADCTMLTPVPLDTLYIAQGPFGAYKFANIEYTDPGGINNGYRFIQYVNGVKDPAVFWDNDEFTDGQTSALRLDNGLSDDADPRTIHSGDNVTIEILSLDDPIYRFWSTVFFGGAAGSAFTASPANPVTNVKGGALGYFSAHSVRRRTVIAP